MTRTSPHALLWTDDFSLDTPEGLRIECGSIEAPGPLVLLLDGAGELLVSFARPDAKTRGRIAIRGEAPGELLRSGALGYAPRKMPAPPDERVEATLLLGASLVGGSRTGVTAALRRVGLTGSERRRLRELGRVEARLLGLAHALVTDPSVVLLEDPFVDLDRREAEVVSRSLDRALDGRSAIACLEGAGAGADHWFPRAPSVFVVERDRLVGPLEVGDLEPTGLWVETEGLSADVLGKALAEEGAEVSLGPSGHSLFVRRAGRRFVLDIAARVGLELSHLAPSALGRAGGSREETSPEVVL